MNSFDTIALDTLAPDTSSPDTVVIDAAGHAGGPLSVPASGWLMGADFAREGSDLVVSGDAGQKFIVMDYFASDTPLDLMTAENGTLRGDIVAQLAGPLNPGEYAQAAGAAQAEPIGVIETLQGVVEATRADGSKVTVSQGDPIFRGDIIETGANGSVSMVMADDSVFSLDADGTVKMDELVFDPDDQEGSMSVSLVKGVFSFVSGQIAKTDPDAMVLNTPLATVGIRGTTGVLDLPEGGEVQIVLAPDDNGETGELTIQVKDALGNPVGAPITVNIPLAAVGIAPGGAIRTFLIPAEDFATKYQSIVSQSTNAAPASNNNDGGEDGGDDGDIDTASGDDPSDGDPPIELVSLVGDLINNEMTLEEVVIPEAPALVPLPEEVAPPIVIDPPEPNPQPNPDPGRQGIVIQILTTEGGNNSFFPNGTSRDDLLSVTIAAPSSDIDNNTISMSGFADHDTMSFQLLAGGMGQSIDNNDIDLFGGEGDDHLMGTISNPQGNNSAEIYDNDISMIGGLGADWIQFAFNTTSVASNVNNIIWLDGQYDNDLISLDWNTLNIESHYSENTVTLLGGMGNDSLLFDWDVLKSVPTTFATISDNTVFMNGESGNDSVVFDWFIQSHTGDTIDHNDISLLGGNGDDLLSLTWRITGGTQPVIDNDLFLNGGNGNDILSLNVRATGSSIGFNNNDLQMFGGAGNDIFNVQVNGTYVSNNSLVLNGGGGMDTFILSGTLPNGVTPNNAVSFQYNNTGDLGDTINGLSAGDNFLMRFVDSNFDGFTAGGALEIGSGSGAFVMGTMATSSENRFIYDNTTFRLLYDADGTGAGAAMVVANFSQDVALTSNNIISLPV